MQTSEPPSTGPGLGPAITIVVPFFQSRRYIRACIESLLRQEGVAGSVEIILINNGSTDGSASIAAEYDGLTVVSEATPGAYAARNTAIRRARAPLIALTDADCVADADWLQKIQRAMEDPSTAMLVGHCRYPADASFLLKMLGTYENAKAEYVIKIGDPHQRFSYANNMAVRSSVFSEIGLFREWKRAADSELVHRLATVRPDLRLVYDGSVRVTHLEFVTAPARAKRLALYAQTNAKISTFKELSTGQRLRIALVALRQLFRS